MQFDREKKYAQRLWGVPEWQFQIEKIDFY